MDREKKQKTVDAITESCGGPYGHDMLWSITTDAKEFIAMAMKNHGLTEREARNLLCWYVKNIKMTKSDFRVYGVK